MSHRVRTLICHLNYNCLVKNNILPKNKLFTIKTVPSLGGKIICPTLYKKLGALQYGLLLEDVIEAQLNNIPLTQVKNALPANLQQYFHCEAFDSLNKLITQEFIEKEILLQPQVEIAHTDIVGHPDFVSFSCVYDVKTTAQFGKMRVETILQLLSYYCLAQLNNLSVTHIGLILPLQNLVSTVSLEGWDWKPFYKELTHTLHMKDAKQNLWRVTLPQQTAFQLLFKQHVGKHIHKDQLIEYLPRLPAAQFFLNGNQTSSVAYKDTFLVALKEKIKITHKPVFIHAPYALNLSQPGKKKEQRDEDVKIDKELTKDDTAWGGWTFYCLKHLLLFGQEAGIKGIVVHCGKTCGRDYQESVVIMRDAVIACSIYATPECPIIIETCAAQCGEVLADPEELSMFYNYLPDFVKRVVSICVDCAHVHGANYYPMEFISILVKNKVPICLVHYNDSKVKKGTQKDRHAHIGQGYIGYEQMNAVLKFCVENKIPMVVE